MSLIKCKECSKEISSKADKCPHCGVKISPSPFKPVGCGAWIGIILIGLILLFVVGGKIADLFSPKESKPQITKKEIKVVKKEVKITKKKIKIKFINVGYFKKKLPNRSNKRVFSVYTPSTNWEAMKKYAQKKMYTAGGVTGVFFFNDLDNTPDVTFVGSEFHQKYEKYLVAVYWKLPNGEETFDKW